MSAVLPDACPPLNSAKNKKDRKTIENYQSDPK